MNLQLKKLVLTNFKGIPFLEIEFAHVTNIYGRNEAGKTTIFDAYLWLLFDKDSQGNTKFGIKPLDKDNNPIHKLDHEVAGYFLVDGVEIVLKKSMREKWVTKRGTVDQEFQGHITNYFWNNVPMKAEDYAIKIASEIKHEAIFKLISNTTYFNSLHWKEKRAVLLNMAGTIDNNVVLDSIATIANKKEIASLTTILNSKKSIQEYRAEIAAKKKKIKDELLLIPSRIDEANRSLPEAIDEKQIRLRVDVLNNELENLDALMQSKTKQQQQHQEKIYHLQSKKNQLEAELEQLKYNQENVVKEKQRARQTAMDVKAQEVLGLERELTNLNSDYDFFSKLVLQKENIASELRQQWHAVNAETITFPPDNEFACPTCLRDYESSKVDEMKLEMLKNFNSNKAKRLSEIKEQGLNRGREIEDNKKTINTITNKQKELITEIELQKNSLKILTESHNQLLREEENSTAVFDNERAIEIRDSIDDLNIQISEPFKESNSDYTERKQEIKTELETLSAQLGSVDHRHKILARINELHNSESEMAQNLANLEQTEFTIEQFVKAQMDILESRINDKFKLVKFKMFEQQINGGMAEACTCLVNGVPYPDVNTAGKVQAGLDIINTLSDYYDAYTPVFIDNRESVTELPESNSQIINLIVSPVDKKLRVEKLELEMA